MPTPILEWDFSTANYAGGTSVNDISGNGNNGVINSTPLSWDTSIGWIELSSAQECRIPDLNYPNNLPVGTAAKSMVYWGTISSYDHTTMSFGGNSGAGSRIDFGYSFTSGTFGIEFAGTGLNSLGYNPGLNTFFQVVITSDTSGTIASSLVYIDGVLRTMTAVNGLVSSTINLPGGPGDPLNTFALNWQVVPGNPKILNAKCYDVVLSPAEIATDYTNFLNRLNPPPPLPSPIAEYDFSNVSSYSGTGQTLYDLSGTGNNLRNTNLTGTFSGTGQSKYYTFAGGADQFWRNNSGIAGTQLFTASMFLWTRASSWSDSGYKCIAGWGEDIGAGGGQIGIWKNVAFDPGYQSAMMGSGVAFTTYPGGLSLNTWIHVGYVVDGTTAKLYVDGAEVSSVAQNFTWPSGTGITGFISNNIGPYFAPIALGGLYDSYYGSAGYDIAIAEFYNVGFATTQVLQLYNSQVIRFGGAPPPPPYVGSVGGRRFGGRFAG